MTSPPVKGMLVATAHGGRGDRIPVPAQLFRSFGERPPGISCGCCGGSLPARYPWLVDAIRRSAFCDTCAAEAGHGDLVARAAVVRDKLRTADDVDAERICREFADE